jgi:hypothetical protein
MATGTAECPYMREKQRSKRPRELAGEPTRAVCEAFRLAQGALRALSAHQSITNEEQIGERRGDEQPVGVLLEEAVADFGEAERPLDNAEGMLDFRTFDFVRLRRRSSSSTTPR